MMEESWIKFFLFCFFKFFECPLPSSFDICGILVWRTKGGVINDFTLWSFLVNSVFNVIVTIILLKSLILISRCFPSNIGS